MPTIPAVDRRVLRYAVAATNRDAPVLLDQVVYAVLPGDARPVAGTTWTTVPVVDGETSITVAGPEAPSGEGVVVPRGTHRLWLRASDNPESITEAVDTIIIR